MRRNAKAVPFDGTPPSVKPGDPVRFRDANGRWFDGEATSEPRYAFEDSIGGKCFLTVAVTSPIIVNTYGHPVNWPAEDVRATGCPEPAQGDSAPITWPARDPGCGVHAAIMDREGVGELPWYRVAPLAPEEIGGDQTEGDN